MSRSFDVNVLLDGPVSGRILQSSELDSIILKLPSLQDRGTLWVHEYEVRRKLAETEEALSAAQQRIEELEEELESLESLPAPTVQQVVQPSTEQSTEVVGRIVAWLRAGLGNGDTVRAKNAQKIASLIESGAYDTGATE
jgi:hypothetical protein